MNLSKLGLSGLQRPRPRATLIGIPGTGQTSGILMSSNSMSGRPSFIARSLAAAERKFSGIGPTVGSQTLLAWFTENNRRMSCRPSAATRAEPKPLVPQEQLQTAKPLISSPYGFLMKSTMVSRSKRLPTLMSLWRCLFFQSFSCRFWRSTSALKRDVQTRNHLQRVFRRFVFRFHP